MSLRRLLKHTSIYSAGNIALKAGALFLVPLYTHVLSLSEYGILELLYSISAVLGGVLGAGLSHATLRFYFEYDDLRDRNAVITTSFLTSLAIVAPILALISLASNSISFWVFHDAKYAISLNIIYLTIAFELLRQIGLAYLRAKEYSTFYVVLCAAQMVIQVICNASAVLLLGMGIHGILAGNCISVGMSVLVLGCFIIWQCGFAYHFQKTKEMMKYSYPFAASSFTSVFFTNADRFLLRSFLSLEAVGIYGLVQKFGMILSDGLLEPFQKSFGAYRFAIMKQAGASEIQAKILKYLLAVSGIAGCILAVFSKEVVRLMTHISYWEASSYIPIIVIGIIIFNTGYVFQTGILIKKKTHSLFFMTLFVDGVGLLIAYVLIRNLGLLGACIALLLKYLVSALTSLIVSQRVYTVRYDYKGILMMMGVIIAVIGVSYSINQFALSTVNEIFLKVLLIGVAGPWIAWIGLDAADLGRLKQLIRQTGS